MKLSCTLALLLLPIFLFSQKATLSGYVREAGSGETLIGANIYLRDAPGRGTVSNAYGFYSLSLEPGTYEVVFNYLGYADRVLNVDLSADRRLNVDMESGQTLTEVVVTAEDAEANVESTGMGTVELATEKIKKLPALFGEIDVLKTLQLLPGVQSAGEGSSGFYVRGGGPDQNLVLLDEATVYNSGHLLGFFSVFNADAIKNTTLIKGGMPPYYGGRLSSVIDIQMKEGNRESWEVDGGVGLVSSRLTVQGPLARERASFIVSGRRTYALDLAQPYIDDTDFAGTNYYFYDFNAKVNYTLSDRDRFYLSGYLGRDVLKFNQAESGFKFDLPYGNTTGTLRWNHLFSDKLFLNLSAIYNAYDFGLNGGQGEFQVDVFSGVRDYNFKLDFDYFASPEHTVKFGANYTYHRLTPQVATATNGEQTFSNNKEPTFAHETALYAQDDWKISDRLAVLGGLRVSTFTQLGPYTDATDSTVYTRNEAVETYLNWEPRLTARYRLGPTSSLKAGITRTAQYLHLVSNSTSTLPADVWVPSSQKVKPQLGWQYAIGYFRNTRDNAYEFSVETYYKRLNNQIDYREDFVDNAANVLENEFVFGEGRAYGLELFVNKRKGRLTGWVGYTLSRTERTFPEINGGRTYRATFDRPNDLSVVASYELSPKVSVSGAFVLGSGQTFTPLRSLYLIEGNLVQEYGSRNSARLQDYHRLDLSLTYVPHPAGEKRWSGSWNLSVYNVYSRKNPFFTYYDLDVDRSNGTASARGRQVSLFPIIPSISYNFSWRARRPRSVREAGD